MIRVVVSCLVLLACTKTSEPAPRGPAARAARMRHHAPQRGPVLTTPQQLFADFTRPDADGIALLDKYRHGATFTATIKTVGTDEAGTPIVWIDVDGENLMTLDFAEPPQALQAGTQLTVTCMLGGASGALMMVTGCTSS
ncbi:MAG TPA: hypothetical protein VIV11_17000 [Kofleriaceae bacterium]